MPRTLSDLLPEKRERIVNAIQADAEKQGWSRLDTRKKGELYRKWEQQYDLSHATVKDRIMKGFDVRQRIPPSGEAAVREAVRKLFTEHGIHVNPSPPMWTGRERADFLIGFHTGFITHVVEVERADSWAEGLRQVLWYRAAYFSREGRQVQPMLVIFGDASTDRFTQIKATCDDNHIVLCSYQLRVEGEIEKQHSLESYLKRNNQVN